MIYRRSNTTNQKWELLRKFPFLIGATVIQLDGRLSFGWVAWCPVGGGLAVFLKKVIITTIQVIILHLFHLFLDFQNFFQRFNYQFTLFCFLSESFSLMIRLLMPWKSFRSDIVPVFLISGIFLDGKYIMVS